MSLLLGSALLAGCAGGDESANQAPTAALVLTQGASPTVWTLDGSASKDPDGDALTFGWNWVIGNATTTEPKIEVDIPAAAAKDAGYLVSLVVRDGKGGAGFTLAPMTFGSGQNKAPKIELAPATRWVKPDADVTLDASTSTDPDGDALTYDWIWGPLGNFDPKQVGVEDACAQSDPTLAVFTTGCLPEGGSFNITFDKPGTYNYHCHPHPWMKARLVVDAAAPAASAPVVVEIKDFAYPQPVTTVGVGSTVSFVNLDPVEHTATVEDFLAGTTSGGSSPVFKAKLAGGDWVARLVVTDPKGGRASQTWGLKASDDAPANPLSKSFSGSRPLVAQVGGQTTTDASSYYNVSFEYNVTATLTWLDPGGQGVVKANVSLGRIDDDGGFVGLAQCNAVAGTGAAQNSSRMNCKVPADNYVFKVTATAGVVGNWTLAVSGIPYSKPPFGDSGGEGGHHHGGGGHQH